ncbi:MAG TPA: dienelactone hydrolase family protein [Alphaproteobacteria bacterium]|jgi:carboxymethylenebutenolidase|nr:dienelactone hydrolase family protein [Alphaproteobacteria bacterium]
MTATTHEIRTEEGTIPTHVFMPDGQKPKSAILFYMDGLGIRQALLDMAARMASHGYAVLLPNLYYRAGQSEPIDPMKDRDRMMQLVMSVTNAGTMNDTKHLLAFLDSQPGLAGAKVACVGYCMGGALSLTAVGTYTDRVTAAASLHGARLATDAPDSPHRLAPKMKGEVYVGVSEIDPYLAEGETERLETALKDADAKAMVEIYPGVQHGFAVPGIPIYDRDASEHHWDRILGLFGRNLPN